MQHALEGLERPLSGEALFQAALSVLQVSSSLRALVLRPLFSLSRRSAGGARLRFRFDLTGLSRPDSGVSRSYVDAEIVAAANDTT